jgi:hypothetical protein
MIMSDSEICFMTATLPIAHKDLVLANAFEQATGFWKKRPPVV